MEKKNIQLRVFGFVRAGEFQLICLDTDVAVRAKSLDEAKKKMGDALISYLNSFELSEIKNNKFRRLAPARYFFLWHMLTIVSFTKSIIYSFYSTADYDPTDHSLRLA